MPPNMTVRPMPAWKHIAGRSSGPGLPVVVICVHVRPSYSHVPFASSGSMLFAMPPYSTSLLRTESKHAPYAPRPPGVAVGNTCVQLKPSNSHVVPFDAPPNGLVFMPPNATKTPRALSHTSE